MYSKNGRTISAEQAQNNAQRLNLSVQEWADTYGWQLSGKAPGSDEVSPATDPTTTPAGDSSSGDISLDLPVANNEESYMGMGPAYGDPLAGLENIQGPELSKSQKQQRIEQNAEEWGMYNLSADAELNRVAPAATTNVTPFTDITRIAGNVGSTKDDIHGVGWWGGTTTTTEEDIEMEIVDERLELDATETNIEFNEANIKDFVTNYYDPEILESAGVVSEDFEGWLISNGFAQDFEEDLADGVYTAAWYDGAMTGEYDQQETLDIAREKTLYMYLERYIQETQEKSIKQAAIRDYKSNPDKYKDNIGFDAIFDKYVLEASENQSIQAIYDYEAIDKYEDEKFAKLKEKNEKLAEKQAKAYLKRKNQSDAAGFVGGTVETLGATIDGFVDAGMDFIYWAETGLGKTLFGGDSFVRRNRVYDRETEEWAVGKNLNYFIASGKAVNIDGTNYILDDDGNIYDTDDNIRVTSVIDAKLADRIKSAAKNVTERTNDVSARGGSVQMGSVLGNIAFQVIAQRGVGMLAKAGRAAAVEGVAISNGFKNAKQYEKYLSMVKAGGTNMRGIKNTHTFGLKMPIPAQTVNAITFQTLYGAASGYENTIREAKAAGLTNSEAEKLAELASLEMAVLYGLTAPINPRVKAMQRVDDFLANSKAVNAAVRNFMKAGKSPQAFRQTLVAGLTSAQKSLFSAGGEGLKEVVQENIQQAGENLLVNKDINIAAGQDLMKTTYSAKDIIETSVLSFVTAGLISGDVNIDLGFKMTNRKRMENLYVLSRNMKGARKRLDAMVESGKITRDNADAILEQAEAVGNMAGRIPEHLLDSEVDVVEVARLLTSIENLRDQKKNIDPTMHGAIDSAIKDAEQQIVDLTKEANERQIRKQAGQVEKIVGEEVVEVLTAKQMEEAGMDQDALNSDGFMEVDGKIIINIDKASETGAISVASHELLHRVLRAEMKNNPEMPRIINELRDVLKSKGALAAIDKRIQDGGYDVQFNEDGSVEGADIDEYITMLSDAIAQGDLTFDQLGESIWRRIGRMLVNTVRTLRGVDKQFENGQQVFDFVKDYQASIQKGKLSAAAKAKAKSSENVEEGERKFSRSQRQLERVKEAMGNLTAEQAQDNPMVEGMLYDMVGAQVKNLAAKFDQDTELEFTSDVLERTLRDIRSNPWNGKGTLYGYLNGRIRKRILDALKADRNRVDPLYVNRISNEAQTILEKEVDTETETATEAATPAVNQTTEQTTKEKPLFKKLTAYQTKTSDTETEGKYISNEDMPQVLRTIANIVGSKSFKANFSQRATDGKQSSKFINELKTALGKSILVDIIKKGNIVRSQGGTAQQAFERFMLQNKKPILENMTTTYLQTAFPHAVEKSVNGVWVRFPGWLGQKIDREASGQGNDLVRRVPNVAKAVTDEQYLEDIRTNPLKGGKEVRSAAKANSVLKAFAEEIGIEIFVEALNDTDSEIYNALIRRQAELGVDEEQISALEGMVQAERGNIKFSRTQPGNTKSISDEFLELAGQNKTNTLLKSSQAGSLYFAAFKNKPIEEQKEAVNNFVSDLKNGALKAMPRGFWFPTDKGSPLLHSPKIIGVSSRAEIWKYYQDEINKLRNDDSLFGDPIIDKNGNEITDFNSYLNKYGTLFGSEAKVLANLENGKIEEFNNGVAAIHEAMWTRFAELIKQDKDNARHIAQFLNFSTNNRNHWQRLGAQFVGYSQGFKAGGNNVTFEHAMPNIAAYLYLLDAAMNNNGNFDLAYNAIISNYKLIALDKESDKKLGGVYKTGMPKGWSVISGYWWQRYFNELVAGNDGGIDPNSIIMTNGQSLGDMVGVKADGTMRTAKGIEFQKTVDQAQLQEDIRTIRETEGRKRSVTVNEGNQLSDQFNKILEEKTGVESFKTYSRIQAEMRGRRKGRFKFFIAPGADDFRGLVHYAFAGKGKAGEAAMKFFEEKLMIPYFKGVAAIDAMRQQIKRDFAVVKKQFREEYKLLGTKIGNSTFTYDHALRVYMWNRQGIEVEGLSQRDKKLLLDAVNNNPALIDLADALLVVARRDAWPDPIQYWEGGTVLSDLNSMTEKIGRKAFLEEFIQNADAIFTEENLNKIEALYGRAHRKAIEDALYAMTNGTNKPRGGTDGQVNKWLNWINGSTGAIMFFNRRSALLQMLSFTNFINWSDNNPVKAAGAFANQKQYWKDFVMIFNSDKLKERRGGLKQDVSESEIADVAGRSKNSPQAILAYLLKIGFTPTQIADSMAIATGGATFYRNRVNTYLKQGMSQKEAEEQAFLDFSMKSDEAQQSSDPALVSSQQRSVLGRLVLAFANTPMQYTRLMKKAGLDLINRRGNPAEHISKIAYYGVVQNFIFSALQSALFSIFFDDDDDEELTEAELEKKLKKEERKTIRVANSMIDTILRGSGVYGAVAATIKNTIMEYRKQEEEGFMADHAYTLLAAMSISPPIQSKLRKIYSAIQTKRFEKDNVEARGWALTENGKLNLGPNYSILGNVLSGVTNLPMDRVVDELKSISEALDGRNKAWQRIALALGWKTWDVGVRNEEADLIKTEAKERRKEEGKKKAAETRRKTKEKKEAEWNSLSDAEKRLILLQEAQKREAKRRERYSKNR